MVAGYLTGPHWTTKVSPGDPEPAGGVGTAVGYIAGPVWPT